MRGMQASRCISLRRRKTHDCVQVRLQLALQGNQHFSVINGSFHLVNLSCLHSLLDPCHSARFKVLLKVRRRSVNGLNQCIFANFSSWGLFRLVPNEPLSPEVVGLAVWRRGIFWRQERALQNQPVCVRRPVRGTSLFLNSRF